MKVKLHKGPHHGKKYEVRDGDSILMMHKPLKMYWNADNFERVVVPEYIRYEMVMLNIGGRLIPSVDPNGYYYFEYKG